MNTMLGIYYSADGMPNALIQYNSEILDVSLKIMHPFVICMHVSSSFNTDFYLSFALGDK